MKVIRVLDDNLEKILLVAMLLLMVIVVFAQVVMRFIFNSSLSWSEEMARYLFVWQVWLGASYAAKKAEHLKVDLLRTKLPERKGLFLELFALILSIGFCCYLVYASFDQTVAMLKLNRMAVSFKMPMWIAYSAVPVGAALMTIRLVQNLIETAKRLHGAGRGVKLW